MNITILPQGYFEITQYIYNQIVIEAFWVGFLKLSLIEHEKSAISDMENLNLYNHKVSVTFNNYLRGDIPLSQLIEQLIRIENQLQQEEVNGSLWFKFSQDDSLATTIPDLQKDLSDAKNKEFTLERMREAISLENELFIHYS